MRLLLSEEGVLISEDCDDKVSFETTSKSSQCETSDQDQT